jgi:type I restriction enzyme S subunit
MSDHTNGRAPKHWKRLPLGELVDILDSRRVPVNAKEREGRQGTVPYYGATGQVGWIDEYLFDEELVLLGEDGAPFFDSTKQKAYVVRGPSWVNNHAHVLRTRDGMPSAFLKHQLDQVDYRPFVSGTTRAKLPQGPMRQIGLLVPPADEQRSIVAAIESHFSRLDAATATLERVQRNLERYRASVLKAAVEGRLVPTEAELAKKEGRSYEPASVLLKRILAERRRRWEEAELAKLKAKGKPPTDDRWKSRYEEPAEPDTDGLPELPEGWCWASVDQLATEVCYGTSAKTGGDDAGVPVIRMGNIVNGALDFSELKFLPSNHDEFPSLLLEPGDLLFNRTNSAELVGKTAVYSGIPSPCSFASYLIRVRVAEGCRSEFVSAFVNSAAGRRWIASVVTQQVGQANVNGSKLRACVLPLPPTSEQVRIVDAVDAAATVTRHLAGDVAAVRVRVARLRQSILKWAFEGRLIESSASMQVQRAAGSA